MKWISIGCLLANASLIGTNSVNSYLYSAYVDDLYRITDELNSEFRSLGHDAIIEPDLEYVLDRYPDLFWHYRVRVYTLKMLSEEYVNIVFNRGLDARIVELVRCQLKMSLR